MTAPAAYSMPDELLGPDEPASDKAKTPAKTRLRDGESGRAIVNRLLGDDTTAANRRMLEHAMVKGAKPFPNDNSGMTNLNFQDGKAIMSQSGVPFYSIFNGVRHYAEIKLAYDEEQSERVAQAQPDESNTKAFQILCDKVSRRFHELLTRWKGFDWHMQQASYWMRLHGTGPAYFDKPTTVDWRFRSLPSGSVLVERGSPSCVDERLPEVAVIVPYRAHELYDFIRGEDEEGYSAAGWNVASVKRAIRNACKSQSWATANGAAAGWDVYVDQFERNGLAVSTAVGFINCAHILVREFNGKVSRFIITQDAVPIDENPAKPDKDQQFLYRSIDAYESYNQALVVFFKDIGDGTWHSVRGYASDAFDTLVVTNQLYCQMIDAARVDSTIILEFATTQQRDKFDKFHIRRGVTKLPVGAKVTQARLQGSMQGAMATAQLLQTKLNNNIGNFQGRGMSREDGRGETVTATEVDARVAKEASLTQGEMTLFYGYLDHLYDEMYRRASDPDTTDAEAKRFQDLCEKDGVPKRLLRNPEYVRANRESGYGSPAMRQLQLRELTELAPSLPTEGQKTLLDMRISAIAGPDKVSLLNPREHVPDMDDWTASVENGMMRQGTEPPPLASGMDDIVHMESHLSDATEYLAPIKEAMDSGQGDSDTLEAAYRYTQLLAPHCEAHLQRLLADPVRREQGQYFKDDLAQITSFNGKLRGAVISARKAAELAASEQQQATALSALDQAKVDSVQTQDQIAAAKAQSAIRDKNMKAMNDIRIKNLNAAATIVQNRAMKTEQTKKAA